MVAFDTPLAAAGGGIVPRGSREAIFQQIFTVFTLLGTAVGVVVVGYMLYTAYVYRDDGETPDEADVERPELGEVPQGGGGGRKLALSLTLSAIIVVSLIAWTYGTLLFVEQGAAAQPGADALEVQVEGYRFGWQFEYPNGHTSGTLRVPEDRFVELEVTSRDVFHTFGIPGLKAKTDAIPGHTTDTWFRADDPGEYTAACYELCGVGHSQMEAPVVVMEQSAFESWYANTTGSGGN